jgi:general secretion pathway protein H
MGRRPEVEAGFTLLELVVALAVVGLALAVVTPAIGRGTDGLRARSQVASFAATLRHARERAISTQRPRRVVVDGSGHRVSVVTPAGGPDEREVIETRALSSRLAIEPLDASEVLFDARGGASGGDFKLTSGSIVYRVTVDRLTGRVRSTRE